jgi:hypothetical protein
MIRGDVVAARPGLKDADRVLVAQLSEQGAASGSVPDDAVTKTGNLAPASRSASRSTA